MTDFPVLDSSRDEADGRVVLARVGAIEPYVDELDYWCTMPVRVTHNPLNGVVIEVGPYTLDKHDIELLRAAISCYDVSNHGPTMRRVQ